MTCWLLLISVSFMSASSTSRLGEDAVYQATGFKVGEVTADSAIIWTRITRNEDPNDSEAPMVRIERERGEQGETVVRVEYPPGITANDIRFAVPGARGQTRVLYRPADAEGSWQQTEWMAVSPDRDYTQQFLLTELQSGTRYDVRVQARHRAESESSRELRGQFRTARRETDAGRVRFAVSTGQMFADRDGDHGFDIYPAMQKHGLDFFVHTGDIVYYDQLAKNQELANYHWQRTYSLPTNVDFHRSVASYFIKDDHDTLVNDCWPTMQAPRMGELSFEMGKRIFRYQVPMGPLTYRRFRHGKHLEIWLVEGRDYRSPNPDPDGPDKTIWGAEQKAWFKETILASDATYRLLISPTPLVGPDRTNKADNHSNQAFAHEGDELRDFIAGQENMFVVCGDRHWQYHSIHPEKGVQEFSCGPASDKHAGGWRQNDFRDDYHQYLNVIGGFLMITVEEADGKPQIEFRFCNAQGETEYTHQIPEAK